MYFDVQMNKKGGIVVPLPVREKLGLKPGGCVRLEVTGESVLIMRPKKDVIAWFREYARKYGVPSDQIVYGDRLYEEGF